jgi:hypothetical protein
MSKAKNKTVKTDTAAGGPETSEETTGETSSTTEATSEEPGEETPPVDTVDTVDLGPKKGNSSKKAYVQKAIAAKTFP